MKFRMKIFGVIMVAHWLEHLFQAYQVYVMHIDRACAFGMLGMKYPWLVKTEILHFGFAVLTTLMFVVAGRRYFRNELAIKFWALGLMSSIWHLFEHYLLFVQALTHNYLFGKSVPTSIIQNFFPRIELHLFYNSVITVLMVAALITESKYRKN